MWGFLWLVWLFLAGTLKCWDPGNDLEAVLGLLVLYLAAYYYYLLIFLLLSQGVNESKRGFFSS